MRGIAIDFPPNWRSTAAARLKSNLCNYVVKLADALGVETSKLLELND